MKISFLCLFFIGAVGCAKPIQRFVPVVVPPYQDTSGGESPTVFVLDTKTGQFCSGNPKQLSQFPLCYDLYKGKQ
jgi:hypothetical protein